MNVNKFRLAIYECCDKETCFLKSKENWDDKNPLYGHCAIVSLLANDY